MVSANDAGRRSFIVAAGGRLLAVAADDLSVLHAWPLGAAAARAAHATLPDQRLALVSGADRVRAAGGARPPRLDVLDAGWDDAVLIDVDGVGDRVLTSPRRGGPLTVRSFPELLVVREVRPPNDEVGWDFTACFLRDHLVAAPLDVDDRHVSDAQRTGHAVRMSVVAPTGPA